MNTLKLALPSSACLVDLKDPNVTTKKYQKLIDKQTVTEHCLTLDIYKPVNSENFPILVWFHEGGFQRGIPFSSITFFCR